MILIGGIVLIIGFIIFIKLFGIIEKSSEVIDIAKIAASIVRDNNIDDYQKEIAMKKSAKRLLSLFFLITTGSILALSISFCFIWLMEFANLLTVREVVELTLSLKYISATIIISIFYIILKKKLTNNNSSNHYTVIEKLLHNFAFKFWSLQVSLSKTESYLYKKKITDIKIKQPVFITALPRAGTTLLLELCVKTNEFGSHKYRDMPFLSIPLLWNHFSKLFMQSDTLRERAHGDGMMINVDSPEAFEEIIWKNFWPSRYRIGRIIPWGKTNYPDFEDFLYNHLRKIIFLRGNNISSNIRYISKNNLNIARIGYLKQVFPDSIIIVPFREPLQHASSLLRQHRNFLKIHKEDPFARKYMEDIGHYDFGENLRPVDFDNWFSSGLELDPSTLLFWLKYWISTYRRLLKTEQNNIQFISYDSLCKNPKINLKIFGELIKINKIESLITNADLIITPKAYSVDIDSKTREILNQANDLYVELQNTSII